MRISTLAILAALAALAAGCRAPGGAPQPGGDLPPLQHQQRRAYPETITGRFVALVDFEDTPLLAERGHDQVGHFAVVGPRGGAERRFVVNVTRTGAGAMEASIPPGAALVYYPREMHDFTRYTLLGMAVYSRQLRDDMKLRISTGRAAWESLPVLLRPGWNDVLIDLHRLRALEDFHGHEVVSIRLWFSASDAPVRINLDDVLLIDNRREVRPLPEGMRLIKTGLDYELHAPGRPEPIRIRQGDDGLWRLGPDQTIVQLGPAAAPASGPRVAREDLAVLGRRRVGEVAVLEHNAIRLRLANTWYFPTSPGQWASLAIPQIRWEYTFYRDGRCITDVVINSAGGEPLAGVLLSAPREVTWSDGTQARTVRAELLEGSVGRFGFLNAPEGSRKPLYAANYVKPAALETRMGDKEAADGDADADGFDQSQGCYRLRARAGHCRFLLAPAGGPLADAVVRVSGGWSSSVAANSEGLALRDLLRLSDGSVLFVLPGVWDRPRWVEVTGSVPPLAGE